jgi:hypothetical protein
MLMKSFYLNFDADIELEDEAEIFLEPDDDSLAFDRRTVDVNGRMTVPDCILSKSCVSHYFGREIPGYDVLGLDPDSIYNLYRDAKELAAAAASFEAVPLMIEHVATTASDPQKPLMAGVVSNVRWKAPYLVGDICVWDADAIRVIESGAQQELSCAYAYRVDMTPGTTPRGERFEGVMRQIAGNHVALVQEGRVGPEAKVRE